MSHRTPSSLLFLALVLTVVVLDSGCNAAIATAKRPPRPAPPPKIHSVKEMRITIAHFTQRLQKAEKGLAPLKTSQSDLNNKFNSYSGRTAHHEWQSANQQHLSALNIRHDAEKLKANIRAIEQVMKTKLGPELHQLQSPSLRRYARDAPTKAQLAQSEKIYKRILELLKNMIECPVHILQFLGEDSNESENDDMPSYDNSAPMYGGEEEEESDTGYEYQYYN